MRKGYLDKLQQGTYSSKNKKPVSYAINFTELPCNTDSSIVETLFLPNTLPSQKPLRSLMPLNFIAPNVSAPSRYASAFSWSFLKGKNMNIFVASVLPQLAPNWSVRLMIRHISLFELKLPGVAWLCEAGKGGIVAHGPAYDRRVRIVLSSASSQT